MEHDFDFTGGGAAARVPHSMGAGSLPPMDFVRYVEAVRPDRIRIQATLFDAQDKRVLAGNVTHPDGVHPSSVPFKTIEEYEAKRGTGGEREQVFMVPLSDRMLHILVDDLDVVRLAKLKADGFRPAVVIESSPGNFQAVLNVESPTDDPVVSHMIDNFITHKLNWCSSADADRLLAEAEAIGDARAIRIAKNRVTRIARIGGAFGYGDRDLQGRQHPHRIPGFHNQKMKRMQPDGTFPVVSLIETDPVTCPRCAELAQDGLRREQARKARRVAHDRNRNVPDGAQDASAKNWEAGAAAASPRLEAIWTAHRCDILKRDPAARELQVDMRVAQRLVVTGHTTSEIESAIASCSQAKHTDDGYPRRVTDKAIGPEAMVAIKRSERYHESWRELERRAIRRLDRETARREKVAAYQNVGGEYGQT